MRRSLTWSLRSGSWLLALALGRDRGRFHPEQSQEPGARSGRSAAGSTGAARSRTARLSRQACRTGGRWRCQPSMEHRSCGRGHAGDRRWAALRPRLRGGGPRPARGDVCLDAETGRRLWESRFNDFLSDTAYDRYAIGSPTVDAETGNVYVITAAGTSPASRVTAGCCGSTDDGAFRSPHLSERPERRAFHR